MSQINDELLKELNEIPDPEKKKKKKKKGKNHPNEEEEKKEEVKEENKKEEEIKKEENNKEEEEGVDNKKSDEDENEEKTNETKKKKKVIKKVVKKKGKAGKKELMLIQLAKAQKQKMKEEEESLIKEEAEREKREREEEELLKKEEEEQRKKEEELKKQEEERKKKLKELNIKESEYKKIEENKKRTEEMLKQQGTNLDEILGNIKDMHHKKKKKKVKAKEEDKKEEDKNEINEESDKDDLNNVEIGEKVIVIESNEAVDNLEDELGDEQDNDNKDNSEGENKFEDEEEENKEPMKKEEEENKEPIKKEDEQPKKVNEKENKKSEKKKRKNIKELKEISDNAFLRALIVCILGHVNVGKTKILDKLLHPGAQSGKAGEITQKICATFIPMENKKSQLPKIKKKCQTQTIQGIWFIDTPGHYSFTNLRSRGISLCDIAVLVLNIDKGIEKESIESLEYLRMSETPYIIVLNQIDKIDNWESDSLSEFENTYRKQKDQPKRLFDEKVEKIKTQFIKNNINAELYYKNTNKEYVNMVPISAEKGEGLPDLMRLLVYIAENDLISQKTYKEEVKCSILEVTYSEKHGTTIDVILVNGTIHLKDKIVIGGLSGPIKTEVKIIILPKPKMEMRVNFKYDCYEQITGTRVVKLKCPNLENALAGSPLFVYKTDEEAEKYVNEINRGFNSIMQKYKSKTGKGIMVKASTLGSLEAILTFLGKENVEVADVGVGNLDKNDVFEFQIKHAKGDSIKIEDLVILCFDNKVLPEAKKFADANFIKIIADNVINHLFDKFKEFKKQGESERKKQIEKKAIFPCHLRTIMFINKKDPLIIGVSVINGVLKIGTPLYCVEEKLPIGVVESIEREKRPINNVRPNDGDVAIRIKVANSSLAAKRHFGVNSTYVSQITSASIEILETYFGKELTEDDRKLIKTIMNILNIPIKK